jgi:predicted transcriptional regulator
MNIKKQRKMAGRLSQIELARLSGVSRFRISLAESGHIPLRTEERAAINRALTSEVQRLANGFQKPGID